MRYLLKIYDPETKELSDVTVILGKISLREMLANGGSIGGLFV
jgi:hypothetical protein